jgi:hypothetical protein
MRIIMEVVKRRRGRPPGSKTKHPDTLAEVWIRVQRFRIITRIQTGRSPSLRQACEAIVAGGGIVFPVGGNIEALAAANAQRNKRQQRFEISPDGSAMEPSANGPIFSKHSITNPRTLQNRYNEAKQIAESDPRVRFAWMDQCRQRLGRPPRKPWDLGRRLQWAPNFIAN